jgi:hypothetical protein
LSTIGFQKIKGDKCKVTEDKYGYTFDFTPLKSNRSEYTTGDAKISICEPLPHPPQGCHKGTGVCGKLPNGSYESWGKWTDTIDYDDGSLVINYSGGATSKACPGGKESKVIFLCRDSVLGTETGPEFIVFAHCIAHFVWQTKLACPPGISESNVKSCKKGAYDLSSLAMSGRNYKIPVGNATLLYDVCSHLVHGKGSRCPYDSGACLVQEDPQTGFLK